MTESNPTKIITSVNQAVILSSPEYETMHNSPVALAAQHRINNFKFGCPHCLERNRLTFDTTSKPNRQNGHTSLDQLPPRDVRLVLVTAG